MEEENMDNNRMMFDWDQGFNQGFTQEQVDGKFIKLYIFHFMVPNSFCASSS